jgi:hypothetical protein
MSGSEDEDDYLSMVISEPTSHQPETSIQRRKRQQLEVIYLTFFDYAPL